MLTGTRGLEKHAQGQQDTWERTPVFKQLRGEDDLLWKNVPDVLQGYDGDIDVKAACKTIRTKSFPKGESGT